MDEVYPMAEHKKLLELSRIHHNNHAVLYYLAMSLTSQERSARFQLFIWAFSLLPRDGVTRRTDGGTASDGRCDSDSNTKFQGEFLLRDQLRSSRRTHCN